MPLQRKRYRHFQTSGQYFRPDKASAGDWFVARTMTRACEWLEDNYKRDKFFL